MGGEPEGLECFVGHLVEPPPGVGEVPARQARVESPGEADELLWGCIR